MKLAFMLKYIRYSTLFTLVLVISLLALGGALVAEHAFGLKPCELCIFQRVPFVVLILAAVIGIMVRGRRSVERALLLLCAAAFFVDFADAAY